MNNEQDKEKNKDEVIGRKRKLFVPNTYPPGFQKVLGIKKVK